MKLISLAVSRPVTTAMFYSAVVLLGMIALIVLPRELFPTITFPELLIVTRYGAAAPEEIENIITKVIEEQAGTVPNLRRVRSISREGLSVVILEFNWGTDMGLAHLAVREKIDLIKDRLPNEAEEPIIQRYNPFAQPMMILSISGNMPLTDLTQIANDVIKKRLQKLDGVASATISGGQMREILAEVDLGKMQSSNISISGIVDSLKTTNVNYPAGTTQGKFYEYLVRTIGEFKNVSDIGKTVVAVDIPRESPEFIFRSQSQKKGAETFQPRAQRLIPLGTLAEIKDAFKETESYSRYNSKSNVSVAIQKQFDANTIKTASRVVKALKELSLSLPKEMNVEIVYDESQFIQSSLEAVILSAVTGAILAFFVLLFFLRNLQDALIVTMSLPISTLIFFIFLYFTNRTINVIGLAGLSLAIGSITDNAICVLDNIDKFRKRIQDPKEASVQAASEVAAPQIASMLTNVVVFIPLLFAKGLAQQLFKDLFYAAVITNIAALGVALTLVPRITAYPFKWDQWKMKKPKEKDKIWEDEDVIIGVSGRLQSTVSNSQLPAPNPQLPDTIHKNIFVRLWRSLLQGLTDERSEKMHSFYRQILVWSLSNRKKVIRWVFALFSISFVILYFLPKIFMPLVDQGQFLIRVNMPVGTRLGVTNRVLERVEAILLKTKEIKSTLVRVGSSSEESLEALGAHQGECIVTIDNEKSSESTEKVILKLKESFKKVNFEGADVEYLLEGSSMKAVTGTMAPIAITIKGLNLTTLRKMSDEIQLFLKKIRGVEGVKTSLALPSYETRVAIDKDRASAFGLSTSEIARASLIGIRGFVATYFKETGKEIPIRVRLREQDRNDSAALQRVSIRSTQGFMVPLGDVAQISAGYGPSEIERIDQQRAITVSAQVIGRSVSDVIEEVNKNLVSFRAVKDYSVHLGGTKQEMEESFGGLFIALMLAIILIYMIMAAGFESLLHPFLIMVTVPLGLIGVVITLLVSFTPLSAPVILGMVLLGGIVVNNGIVMIEYVNQLREEGMSLMDSVVTGCGKRLRPILMTATVNILALVPVAFLGGRGTEMASPMALATLGGLLISTLLTLIVLPILYVMVEERHQKVGESDQ